MVKLEALTSIWQNVRMLLRGFSLKSWGVKVHKRKMIAPIVISIVIVIYYIAFAIFCIVAKDIPFIAKALGILIPLALAGVCIFVLFERIREIRSGEEDDLSKY